MIDHVSHHARTESSANRYLVVPAGALNPFNSRLAWQSTLFRYVPVTEFATTQGASLPLGQSPCQAIYSIRARSEAGRNPEEINPQLLHRSTAYSSVFHDEGNLLLVKFRPLFYQRATSAISNHEELLRSQPANQPASLARVSNFEAELRNNGAAPPF